MASSDHDVRVLSGLIHDLHAAAHALEDAAGEKGGEAGDLHDLLLRRAADQNDAATGLEAEVSNLGAAPRAPSQGLAEMLGMSPPLFAGLKSALGHGEDAALDALETGEAQLLARFDDALADPGTSGPVRDAILRAYDPVKAGRDAVLQRRGG